MFHQNSCRDKAGGKCFVSQMVVNSKKKGLDFYYFAVMNEIACTFFKLFLKGHSGRKLFRSIFSQKRFDIPEN